MVHQGNILKKLVKSANIKIGEFANKAGISRQYLYILHGKEILDDSFIDLTCKLLNVNKNVFTDGIKDENKENKNNKDLEHKVYLLEKMVKTLEVEMRFVMSKLKLNESEEPHEADRVAFNKLEELPIYEEKKSKKKKV